MAPSATDIFGWTQTSQSLVVLALITSTGTSQSTWSSKGRCAIECFSENMVSNQLILLRLL